MEEGGINKALGRRARGANTRDSVKEKEVGMNLITGLRDGQWVNC